MMFILNFASFAEAPGLAVLWSWLFCCGMVPGFWTGSGPSSAPTSTAVPA